MPMTNIYLYILESVDHSYCSDARTSYANTSFTALKEPLSGVCQVVQEEIVHETVDITNLHHQGPMPIGYENDLAKRRTKFTKRSSTILNMCRDLHNITGAKVKITITSNDGPANAKNKHKRLQKSYHSSGLRTVLQQTEQQTEQQVPVVPDDELDFEIELPEFLQTPKKKKMESKNEVHRLPGIKKRKTKIIPLTDEHCDICKIKWNGVENEGLDKLHGIQNKSIGCDVANCLTWVHVRCVNIKLRPKQKRNTIPFKCNHH